MKRRSSIAWLCAGPLAVLVAVLAAAHPHLAVTETAGADVLVVEGWMGKEQLAAVARLADSAGYGRIYCTGTLRPFSYYLPAGASIVVHFAREQRGTIAMNVSGVPGAGYRVVADGATVMEHEVGPQAAYFVSAGVVAADSLVITSLHAGGPAFGGDNIFIKFMRIGGKNIHAVQDTMILMQRQGIREPGWPTFADKCAADLAELGVHPAPVPVRAPGTPDSRTWANASHFAVRARADGIRAFDVVTVGVHGRRTRALFQRACGPGIRVGIISLDDPECPRRGWWRKRSGWFLMLKELGGAGEPLALDLTR